MRGRPSALAAVALFLAAIAAPGTLPAAPERPHRPWTEVNPYFGINAHLPSADDFDAIEKAGFGFVRVDFTWDRMEPLRGQIRWDLMDPVVEEADAHGVRLVAILGFCPPWASSGPSAYYPPRHARDWKEFVSALVKRYRGRVRHWILWNEPNSSTFFRGSTDQFIQQVLIPGAEAAKAADPGCKIVGPDLAHLSGARWDTWLDKILAEAGSYLDIISHHCYKDKPAEILRMLEGPSRPWEPPPVQRIIERRGQGSKPFWLTEVGWRSTHVGPAKQSGYLISTLQSTRQRGWISKVFLYELRDSPQEPGFGLMTYAGKPKQAYTDVRGFIRSVTPP